MQKTVQEKIQETIKTLKEIYSDTDDYNLAARADTCVDILTGMRDI